jgi:hypothetical protein
MLIYFDSVIVIYLIDHIGTFQVLHLAAAIEGGCDRLLTNDYRLSRCTDIAVEVLT